MSTNGETVDAACKGDSTGCGESVALLTAGEREGKTWAAGVMIGEVEGNRRVSDDGLRHMRGEVRVSDRCGGSCLPSLAR